MRLWTLHPKYLDTKGLLALWREALLAQKVLSGETVGYRHHPQLKRFKAHSNPAVALATYLHFVYQEAVSRGYHFNGDKIGVISLAIKLSTTDGQLLYEWEHLKAKLIQRDERKYEQISEIAEPEAHPMFEVIVGERESWEVSKSRS